MRIRDDYDTIASVKETISSDELCSFDKGKLLKSYIDEVFAYEYTEEPYYSKLKHLLVAELIKLDKAPCNDIFGVLP